MSTDEIANVLQEQPRLEFTLANVVALPKRHGVYAIFESGNLIYIGSSYRRTGTLRQRMMTHLNGPGLRGPGDQFRNYLAQHRNLAPEEEAGEGISLNKFRTHRLATYRTHMDRYIQDRLVFTWAEVEPGPLAHTVENALIALLRPEFNKPR